MNSARELYFGIQLENVPLFSNLSTRQMEILCKAGVIKKFARDDVIVYQDEPGDTFYIVVSGRVKVTLINEDGKEIILSILKGGDFFGDLSLLDNEPRSASVIAVEDATLFLLTQSQFHQLMTAYPDMLRKVLREMCARLRRADEKIGSLAFLDVYGRTIAVLQQLVHDQGRKTKHGMEIVHAPTHEELSRMVGASREAITRIIKVLRKNRSLISYKGRKVVLRATLNKPIV